jgi:hypothetical protein
VEQALGALLRTESIAAPLSPWSVLQAMDEENSEQRNTTFSM